MVPLPRDEAIVGVAERPNVGDDTRDAAVDVGCVYIDPGRVSRDGDRPLAGFGEFDRGGGPDPFHFFCVKVREKMACDRDDWAFISVSFVRLMDVP